MKSEFTSPIATREFTRTDTGGSVTVELGRPHRRRAGEFECSYRIRGFGRAKLGRALGEDSIQALQLAFEAVRLELEPYAGRLAWFGAAGETGFPQFVPYSFGEDFANRVKAMVDRETKREARLIKQRARRKSTQSRHKAAGRAV